MLHPRKICTRLPRSLATALAVAALALTLLAVAAPAAADDSPAGMVAFFTGSSCPSGWKTASYASGRLVVAVSVGDQVGGTVGKPLDDREDRTHEHPYSTKIDMEHKSISAASGCCNDQGAKDTDNNEAKGTTAKSTSNLPFTQLVICEKS